jgi:hypothetical protein
MVLQKHRATEKATGIIEKVPQIGTGPTSSRFNAETAQRMPPIESVLKLVKKVF